MRDLGRSVVGVVSFIVVVDDLFIVVVNDVVGDLVDHFVDSLFDDFGLHLHGVGFVLFLRVGIDAAY